MRDPRAMWFKDKNKCMGLGRKWNQKESGNLIGRPQENTVQPFIHLLLLKIVL